MSMNNIFFFFIFYLILLYIVIILAFKLNTKVNIKKVVNYINITKESDDKIHKIKITHKSPFIKKNVLYINLFYNDNKLLEEVLTLLNNNYRLKLKKRN